MKEQAILFWSGGKDSALTLFELQGQGCFEVVSLLTTVTEESGRVGMHRVRRELLERQQQSAGIPLCQVVVPENPSNDQYEARLKDALAPFLENDCRTVVFGDLFLEDIRRYREDLFSSLGMKSLFPLWKRDTRKLADEFIAQGFKAVVVCVDLDVLDSSFLGASLDEDFLRRLPPGVDPCGENGEFHTFVHEGPVFREPIPFAVGETSRWHAFGFCDLVPAG